MIGSLVNVVGPDLIVFPILVLLIGGAVAIVRFAIGMNRKKSPVSAPIMPVEERLRKLEELKAKGLLTSAEYERQRQNIISHI